MYRLSSDIAPYLTHPDMPQFHAQLDEARDELAALGAQARQQGLRLSFHPSQYIILNSADQSLNARSARDIEAQTAMLDLMGASAEAVVVVHAGGVYGEKEAASSRWITSYENLSAAARRRLVLENDDISYSTADVRRIHDETGVPLIFDHQHWCCHNPEQSPLLETLRFFLSTWPVGVRPKIHFSSPRTELRQMKRRSRKTKKIEHILQPPLWTNHADYNNPFTFIELMRSLADFEFDVMLEAKAKDLALRRLRTDLQRYAPEVAARFGLAAKKLKNEEEEIIVTADTDADDDCPSRTRGISAVTMQLAQTRRSADVRAARLAVPRSAQRHDPPTSA